MTFREFTGRAARLSVRTKVLCALAAVALAAIVGASFAVARDTRTALFATPLKSDQLAEVEQRLAAWNIPYAPQIDNVRIDAARRANVLLRLAVDGVPHAHLTTSEETLARVVIHLHHFAQQAEVEPEIARDRLEGGQGQVAPGFAFATLYRLRGWTEEGWHTIVEKGQAVAAADPLGQLFPALPAQASAWR